MHNYRKNAQVQLKHKHKAQSGGENGKIEYGIMLSSFRSIKKLDFFLHVLFGEVVKCTTIHTTHVLVK